MTFNATSQQGSQVVLVFGENGDPRRKSVTRHMDRKTGLINHPVDYPGNVARKAKAESDFACGKFAHASAEKKLKQLQKAVTDKVAVAFMDDGKAVKRIPTPADIENQVVLTNKMLALKEAAQVAFETVHDQYPARVRFVLNNEDNPWPEQPFESLNAHRR